MFRRFTTLFMLMMFLLSACAAPAGNNVGTPPPDQPSTNQPGEPQTPIEPGWLPADGDENLIRTNVILEWAEILTLESFPPQFTLNLRGSLLGGCDRLRVDVGQPDANNRIQVFVYSVRPPNQACTEALVPFDVNIPLRTGAPGEYTMFVNDEQLGEFVVPGAGEQPGQKPVEELSLERGNAFVEEQSISTETGVPVLYLAGYLPTPCHQLKVDVEQVGSEVKVSVYSQFDPSVMCIQVTEPFETSVKLPQPASAKYSVSLNGEVIGEVQP